MSYLSHFYILFQYFFQINAENEIKYKDIKQNLPVKNLAEIILQMLKNFYNFDTRPVLSLKRKHGRVTVPW